MCFQTNIIVATGGISMLCKIFNIPWTFSSFVYYVGGFNLYNN